MNVHEVLVRVAEEGVQFDGISVLTILPAPMMTLSPIVTPGSMTDRHPMKQFLPTVMGPYITVSGF